MGTPKTLTAAVLAAVLLSAPAAPAAAHTGFGCHVHWGSQPRQVAQGDSGQLVDVRAGRHQCFDRLVLDVSGDVSGYYAGYTDQATHPTTGEVIPLRGGADLQLGAYVSGAAPDAAGGETLTYDPADDSEAVDVRGFTTLRQVAYAGTWEGTSDFGVGVRARLPFRVFVIQGEQTDRVVVDVAHRW